MVKESPVKTIMTKSEYARHRGVSPAAVHKWIQKGKVVLTFSSRIDVSESDKILDKLQKVKKQSSEPNDGKSVKKKRPSAASKRTSTKRSHEESSVDIDANREALADLRVMLDNAGLLEKCDAERVKENYLAVIRKLEAEQKAGALVEVAPIKKRVYELYRRERDALLNLPSRIGAVMAAELGVDQNELVILLEKHINEFLDERAAQPRMRFS